MAPGMKLGQKQTQKLILTQTQRQALELLQLSNIELLEKITKELEENPILEEDNVIIAPAISAPERELIETVSQTLSGNEDSHPDYENATEVGGDIPDRFDRISSDDSRKRDYIESAVSGGESLTDHLLAQARISARDEAELTLLEYIITALDENGMLPFDAKTLAEKFSESVELVQKAISSVQLFDPVGCAAASVRDSLLIQAAHYYPNDSHLQRIISDHLHNLEYMRYDRIAGSLGISEQTIVEKCKLIKTLNPYPGRQFENSSIRYIIPEVDVKLIDGEIIITFNDEWIPPIKINSYYTDLLRKKNIEKKLKDFIQDRLQSARALVKNIQSRRDTILKVVKAIMHHQQDFLIKGPGHLKPLVQAEIAHEVGMHESTVSRVTSNKFAQTPWGVFELKHFFATRIRSEDGNERSSDEAASLIRDIIAQENPAKPLSDDEIQVRLKKAGIEISRRTIAKYRGNLNIPPSHMRKRKNFINRKGEQ